MADHEEKIQQFMGITGANYNRAKFFLESAAWDVEIAVSRYFENYVDEGDNQPEPNQTETEVDQTTEQSSQLATKKKNNSNFATLNTLTTSSDDEEGQAYYAGGSEHSGQQVLGPPKKRDIVADMFKSVQEHGVEVLEPGTSSHSKSFKGTGYKLGQNNQDTEVIPGTSEPDIPQEVNFRLWQNGFTINEGDLRSYTDPANKEFLSSIQRGEIPQELKQGNAEIYLAMEDHRQEQYKPSKKKKVKAFEGQGYTLGSPAPAVVGVDNNEDKSANETNAKLSLKLDSSQPITNIQIRLADGSRLVGQFNHGHTVGELRSYITAARPQYEFQPFNLLSTYPSKLLQDSQTLQEAGLLNSAIMQKLI